MQPEPVKPASEKSVMFDLQPQEFEFTPDGEKVPELSREQERPREHERVRERDGGRRKERRGHRGRRDESPASDASDSTIELPPRFDQHGRVRDEDEDPLAAKLESVLSGLFR